MILPNWVIVTLYSMMLFNIIMAVITIVCMFQDWYDGKIQERAELKEKLNAIIRGELWKKE